MLRLVQREGCYWVDKATPASSSKKLWLVVRDLATSGHKLLEGDVIKRLGSSRHRGIIEGDIIYIYILVHICIYIYEYICTSCKFRWCVPPPCYGSHHGVHSSWYVLDCYTSRS